jgi:hypothetical protein
MGITPNLPIQSTGYRGQADAWLFRAKWALIGIVSTPVLVFVLITVMKLIPETQPAPVVQGQME